MNTQQDFTVYFLNNFPIYHLMRTLWIHVTLIPFIHPIWICKNTGNYINITTYTSFGICFEYLNNGFCIISYTQLLYTIDIMSYIIDIIQAVVYIPRIVKIKSCIFRFTVLTYGKRSYKCSICFRTYHAFCGELAWVNNLSCNTFIR